MAKAVCDCCIPPAQRACRVPDGGCATGSPRPAPARQRRRGHDCAQRIPNGHRLGYRAQNHPRWPGSRSSARPSAGARQGRAHRQPERRAVGREGQEIGHQRQFDREGEATTRRRRGQRRRLPCRRPGRACRGHGSRSGRPFISAGPCLQHVIATMSRASSGVAPRDASSRRRVPRRALRRGLSSMVARRQPRQSADFAARCNRSRCDTGGQDFDRQPCIAYKAHACRRQQAGQSPKTQQRRRRARDQPAAPFSTSAPAKPATMKRRC